MPGWKLAWKACFLEIPEGKACDSFSVQRIGSFGRAERDPMTSWPIRTCLASIDLGE